MKTMGSPQRGFTLVEMVVSLAVASVFVVFAGTLIRAPLDSYIAQSDRAKVLDAADAGWPQIERDIHEALPNSARARQNGTVSALELLRVEGASSRHTSSLNAANITLVTRLAGDLPRGVPLGGRIAVFSNPAAIPYQPNVMTPAGSTLQLVNGQPATQDVLTITPALTSATPSAKNYLYFVREAVTYLCDTRARTLVRYHGYTISASQAARDTATELNNNGAASAVVARNITACRFSAPPSPGTRGQIVTVSFTSTVGKESTTVAHQASLDVPQ